ncbi:hypothetical protein P4209_02425 [Pseudomonas aeruginosa]|nr:hypothetical protein [Pseudomonas aeruginosa]MDF5845530.1 hypothetical protein [Pseudomonas aeruginosa]MDF5852384.1 hypothetical protein [Pseudomonas aeruginosa]MDF5882080.1 hypothetical protein [Pseudomonas aeruginosa]MDF5921134.1 hypothetical protein [Pseudomonas aeruginosa]
MTSIDISNTRQLLERASNDDLEPLVEYILKANTESLSKQVDFKRSHPEHRRYASSILDELRLFGGNSFVNLWRKSGPSYTEVVRDVASKLKVKGLAQWNSLNWRRRWCSRSSVRRWRSRRARIAASWK